MKREWTDLEFADWILLPSEAALLANKTGPTRLGFAVLLKFFQYAARFPLSMQEVPTTAVHRSVPSSAFASRRCKMPRSWPSGYLSTSCRKAILMNTSMRRPINAYRSGHRAADTGSLRGCLKSRPRVQIILRDGNYLQHRQALRYRSDRCSLGADRADVASSSARWPTTHNQHPRCVRGCLKSPIRQLKLVSVGKGRWGATEQNAELRILLQLQSPIKSRVTEFRYSSILERQELCRLSYSGFY